MRKIITLLLFFMTQNIVAQCFHQTTDDDDITIISDEVNLSKFIEIPASIISEKLKVSPYIGVYESSEINAVAYRENQCDKCGLIKNSSKYGYIFVSSKLNKIAEKNLNKAMFIISHELGHILFFNMVNDKSFEKEFSVKHLELFADYIAAFSLNIVWSEMSQKKEDGEIYNKQERIELKKKMADNYARVAFDGGDTGFNNPTHHGTKLERIAAFNAGWRKAEISKSRNSGLTGGLEYIIKEAGLDIKIQKQ